jgi:hypothetical protein
MSQIPIERRLFDKDMFGKVVDTSFHQLLNNQVAIETPTFTIDDFFALYESLFYQIPKEGDSNSHRYILEKEASYLGVIVNSNDIQALLDEITSLRQQLLDTQTIVSTLQSTTKTTGA